MTDPITDPVITNFLPPFVTFGLPNDEVIAALTSGTVDVKRRCEIYEADAVTPFDISRYDARLVDGTITVDSTRDERRMIDITLDNGDYALNLNPIDGFWYDKILKVFWGIEYFSGNTRTRWETQIGEFMIDRIDEDYFPNTCKVTGRDYAKKCLVSQILNSIQFNPATPIENIIVALAANSGIKKFRMPYTGLSFTDAVVFEPGTARWEVMKKVADSVGYEIYFTPDGYLTMRPYQDPSTSPITWVFQPGKTEGTLVEYKRTSDDSLVKNHCVVIGNPQSDDLGYSQAAFGEARNDDPQSPTNIDRIGDRVDLFKSDYITDATQAQAIAEARLRVSALEQYTVDFSSMVLPFLEAGDITDVINDKESNFTPARFLLSNFSIPLNLGKMTCNGRRVTIVGSQRQFGVL
jgi:hypothetical protein